MALRRNVILLLLVSSVFASICLGQALPSTFFGLHVNQNKTPWPSVTFGSYRMWDDGTAWTAVNPSNGVYNWAPIDAWVAKAQQQNVQLLYTFGRTPQWASSNPTLSCDYGPGQCVAPTDMRYWDSFVTALATRYKGKIKYYEMWNEPNQPVYWKGTTAQLVEMTNRAAAIIHSIDPNAKVGTPAATWTSTTAWAWLDGFLAAGGGSNIDVIDFHGYTGNNNAATILTIIDNIQKVRDAHGLSALPLLISEGSWGVNGVIPNEQNQAAFLVQRYLLIMSRPEVKAFFWYEWDSSAGWGTLWDSTSGVHPAGVAYGQMTKLLIGATPNGCSEDSTSTWVCSFTLANGSAALGVWNATTSASYTPGSEYAAVLGISGASSAINGSDPYVIGNAPIFFTASSQPATPTVTLTVTPQTGTAPTDVTASATAAVPSGVTVSSAAISFGDGTTVSGWTARHNYSQAGTYQVRVTVVDNLKRIVTATQNVDVTAPQPPKATLTVSPASGNVPLQVIATVGATGSTTSITSSIDFGDGTVANAASASHTYTAPGNYTVTGKVSSQGASSTANVTVNALGQAPVAAMALTQIAAVGYKVSTSGSYAPSGTLTSTVISWGDGQTTVGISGTHVYYKAGAFKVTVTVTDNHGMTASTSAMATTYYGIYIVSPKVAFTTNPDVHVVAYAAAPDPIVSTTIVVDGQTVFTGGSWDINTYLPMTSGAHNVTILAVDQRHNQYTSRFSITIN